MFNIDLYESDKVGVLLKLLQPGSSSGSVYTEKLTAGWLLISYSETQYLSSSGDNFILIYDT